MGKQLSRQGEKQLDQIREIRDKLFLKTVDRLGTVLDVPDYDENVDPKEVTPEEVQKWGSIKEAQLRKRMIRDYHKPKSKAPIYIQETRELAAGLSRMIAKDTGNAGNTTNNILVYIQGKDDDPLLEAPSYDVIDVDAEEQE